MSLFVLFTFAVGSSIWWARSVLRDEAKYLRAVAPLAGSQFFARLSAHSLPMIARRCNALGWIMDLRGARHLSTATKRLILAPGFGVLWRTGHRCAHRYRSRHRRAPGYRTHDLQLQAGMIALAAIGTMMGMFKTIWAAPSR